VSLGERVPELAAVAAPVFGVTDDADAGLLGVLSLSGLRSRFDGADLERRRELVVAAAHRLSASLGAPAGTEIRP
jgi:DNA-binding IclR family transcriptional regulator